MHRRSRPTHHASPRGKQQITHPSKEQIPQESLHPRRKPINDSLHGVGMSDSEDFTSESGSGEEGEDEESETEDDADAPRASRWIDEDELGEIGIDTTSDEEGEIDDGPSQLKKLQNSISNLPFGALRKARYAVNRADTVTDSGSEGEEDMDLDTRKKLGQRYSELGQDEHSGRSTKQHKDIAKRPNKHAPTEVTSKKPVPRLRHVVEAKKSEPRDPRFLSVTGEFKADKFQQNYGFLADAHQTELKTLRENLKRARKMLGNAPRHLRDEYEEEVQHLELAVKRAESIVNRDRTDRIQREALQKALKEERDKRKQGKGDWYMKKSAKRELVTRARYDALATEGGKRLVRRAIEKKQKKISQKEKKSRPFPQSGSVVNQSRKRNAEAGTDSRKRRRVG